MSAEDDQTQYDELAGGPGAPTPLSQLEVCNAMPSWREVREFADGQSQGTAGLTKRDIQLFIDGGYNTVESVAYTPRKILEQIKGISEQKATKILTEGMLG